MKKINLFVLCISICLFSSCGKDFSETLLGTWTVKSVVVLPGCDEPELEDITVENGCILIDGERSCISLTFLENGLGEANQTINGTSDTEDFTYTVDDETEIVTICDDGDCQDFVKVGDNLEWTFVEEECDLMYTFEMN